MILLIKVDLPAFGPPTTATGGFVSSRYGNWRVFVTQLGFFSVRSTSKFSGAIVPVRGSATTVSDRQSDGVEIGNLAVFGRHTMVRPAQGYIASTHRRRRLCPSALLQQEYMRDFS